jgi:hypothetical protein
MFHGLLTYFMDAVWLSAYVTGSVDFKINGREGYDAVVPYVTNKLWEKDIFIEIYCLVMTPCRLI